jgi:hypothetical protein
VSDVPQLPDLSKLTEAQKDELIVSLWQTVLALEGGGEQRPAEVAAPPRGVDELRSRIGRTAASRRAWTPRRGHGFLESRLLLGVLLVIGLGFLGDFAIGWYQQRSLEVRNRAALVLENAAFNGLDAELLRVVDDPDGRSYRATMAMRNLYPDSSLYVMLNPLRVFVQVGLVWQEQPAHAPDGAGRGVVKLTADHDYQVTFQVDAKDWTELMPGYMHVRIDNDMLISRSSEPGNDIVERNNRFYVYLKPQGADDEAIKRRSKFRGAPPVFIPMPPH